VLKVSRLRALVKVRTSFHLDLNLRERVCYHEAPRARALDGADQVDGTDRLDRVD